MKIANRNATRNDPSDIFIDIIITHTITMRRSRNNDITAPISRARRKKGGADSSQSVYISIITCILIFMVVIVLSVISNNDINDNAFVFDDRDKLVEDSEPIKSSGGSKLQKDRSPAANQSNKSLRRIAVDEQYNEDHDEGLLIHTDLGTIRIYFTPQLSGQTSIDYIQDVATDLKKNKKMSCDRCNFYRAEPDLLLQGVLSQHNVINKVTLGPCPESSWKPSSPCPPHDPNCGCHGPIMTRGMVGWAGGSNGPDFFINTHKDPVVWWEHQHTVWGQVRDTESLELVEKIYKLPAKMNGMRMLEEKIIFNIELF